MKEKGREEKKEKKKKRREEEEEEEKEKRASRKIKRYEILKFVWISMKFYGFPWNCMDSSLFQT